MYSQEIMSFERDSIVSKSYKRVSLIISDTKRIDLINDSTLDVWNPRDKVFIIHNNEFLKEEREYWIKLIKK